MTEQEFCPDCGGLLNRGTYDAVEGARYRWCTVCGAGPVKFSDPSWGDLIVLKEVPAHG